MSFTESRVDFSVVIPAHNAGRTLDQCLEHAKAMEGNKEIIVVDDHSTDHTGEIALRHGVICLSSPARGPSAARNLGAGNARGEYLLFVDSDVYVPGDLLTRLESRLREHPEAAAIQTFYSDRFFPHNMASLFKQQSQYSMMHRREFSEMTQIGTSGVAIRKAAFEQMNGFDEQLSRASVEDQDLGLRLLRSGWTIVGDQSMVVDHDCLTSFGRLIGEKFWRANDFGHMVSGSGRQDSATAVSSIVRGRSYYSPGFFFSALLAPGLPLLVILALLISPLFWVAAAVCAAVFVLLNIPQVFLRPVRKGRIKLPVFTFIRLAESLAMFVGGGLGVAAGLGKSLRAD